MLLLALEVVGLVAFHHDIVRGPENRPLFAIGIVTRFADRVVRDHVVTEVVRSGIGDLVRVAWTKEKRVARSDFCHSSFVAHLAAARDDKIELRLSRVRVIRAERAACGNVSERQIKRVAFCEIE